MESLFKPLHASDFQNCACSSGRKQNFEKRANNWKRGYVDPYKIQEKECKARRHIKFEVQHTISIFPRGSKMLKLHKSWVKRKVLRGPKLQSKFWFSLACVCVYLFLQLFCKNLLLAAAASIILQIAFLMQIRIKVCRTQLFCSPLGTR